MVRWSVAGMGLVVAGLLGGCFAGPAYVPPTAYQAPDTAAATAAAMGNPTQHTAAELDAFLAKNLAGYQPVGDPVAAALDGSVRLPVRLERGKCYFMVLRLGPGASYSQQALAGYRFDFDPRGGGAQVSGGPGVYGPGGAGSAGCRQQDGEYDFVLRTVVGASETGLGSGPISLQLFARDVSEAQLEKLQADQDRQIEQSRRFQQEREAKEAKRLQAGCAKCEARYQGCRGAGRTVHSCQADFRSCAFENAGSRWMSACQVPID